MTSSSAITMLLVHRTSDMRWLPDAQRAQTHLQFLPPQAGNDRYATVGGRYPPIRTFTPSSSPMSMPTG